MAPRQAGFRTSTLAHATHAQVVFLVCFAKLREVGVVDQKQVKKYILHEIGHRFLENVRQILSHW